MNAISSALSAWSWPTTLDFSAIQEKVSALVLELGLGPGSLYSEIVNESPDSLTHPEVEWDAEVRLGEDLCFAEQAFIGARKRYMKTYFAKLFGVPEKDIDERDLPIVAIAGSGGGMHLLNLVLAIALTLSRTTGFRAMLNTTGSLIGAQRSGILPCVTYTAGVSGKYNLYYYLR